MTSTGRAVMIAGGVLFLLLFVTVIAIDRKRHQPFDPPELSDDRYVLAVSTSTAGGRGVARHTVEIVALDDPPEKLASIHGRGGIWAPDGRSIALGRKADDSDEVWVVGPLGKPSRRILRRHDWACPASWTPDGTAVYCSTLTYTSSAWGDNPVLHSVPTDGKAATQLTRGSGYDIYAIASPKGDLIVFPTYRNGDWREPADVTVMATDGTGRRKLTTGPYDWVPSDWSPDGEWIYVGTDEGSNEANLAELRGKLNDLPRDEQTGRSEDVMAALALIGEMGAKYSIYRMRPDGTERELITEGAPAAAHARCSPVGDLLSCEYWDAEAQDEIYVVGLDGGDPRNISRHPLSDLRAEWSHDGKMLAWVRYDATNPHGPSEAVACDLETLEQTVILKADAGERVMMVEWRPAP